MARRGRSRDNKEIRLLKTIEDIANSSAVQDYLGEAEQVKPWSLKYFENIPA